MIPDPMAAIPNWSRDRSAAFDGQAREQTALDHENEHAKSERIGFIALRVQLAATPEPQRYIPHSMRYV